MRKKSNLKALLAATLSAAALFGSTAKADENKKSEGTSAEKTKIETIQHSSILLPFADKNGNFDKKAAEEAFDALKYKEKLPQILKIYEDGKKDGSISRKQMDKLLSLFPQKDKMSEDILKRVSSDLLKKGGENFLQALGGLLLAVTALASPSLAIIGGGSVSAMKEKSLRPMGFSVLMLIAAFVATGPYCMYKGNEMQKETHMKEILTSPENMKAYSVGKQEEAFREYKKRLEQENSDRTEGKIVTTAPSVFKGFTPNQGR